MPELPEVETTVKDLSKARPPILGARFVDVWTDSPKMIKSPRSFDQFKKEIKRKKIEKIWRRGKNIIFELIRIRPLPVYYLLIHQKLTGHLLLGKWALEKGQWQSKIPGAPKEDPMNRFLHLIFWVDNGQMLALSDLRKFAKVELLDEDGLEKELGSLGPEPLTGELTFEKFKKRFEGKKGKIKQVLMDQNVIAGIGNIYSDEILWQARIHPFKDVSKLSNSDFGGIYRAMREILSKAIELGGESISDFRRISGERGGFTPLRKVYRREGEKCSRCGRAIKRVKIGGRSAHFCPTCQKEENEV